MASMMKMIKVIGLILGQTFLVTFVLTLTFSLFGLLGLPVWAQGFAIIPAGWVFARLSGERVPPVRHWLPFLLGLTLLMFVFDRWLPQVPVLYKGGVLMAYWMAASKLFKLIPPSADRAMRPGRKSG